MKKTFMALGLALLLTGCTHNLPYTSEEVEEAAKFVQTCQNNGGLIRYDIMNKPYCVLGQR